MRMPRLPLFAVLLLFPVNLLSAWDVDLSLAVPGGIVSVAAVDREEISGGVELWYQGRRVSSAEGIPAAVGYVALLPLPCDLSAGEVELRVKNALDVVSSLELTIEGRDFIYEEISLNTAMSELRQSDDPRKMEESRRMWELLGSFDPAASLTEEALVLPVGEARQSSSYGDRRLFLYRDGGESRSLHYGIDYAVPVGTPVAAAAGGKVVLAADRMLTGLSVVLEHGPGIFSIYYHLDSLLVNEGDRVENGETIGSSGMTGLATGAHLHWELRINRVPVDPLLFLHRPFVLP
ncbi:M23 family metallopeptidase [Marispirochaeta sp.]|uniref:M23 family metallopeptidase n=1 Tax=Marispirochaeta sp. TaxID=2038653 RepID=UPI0029C6664B|nr:M23 family metallopeptidase [Marispirochaeta sp.]